MRQLPPLLAVAVIAMAAGCAAVAESVINTAAQLSIDAALGVTPEEREQRDREERDHEERQSKLMEPMKRQPSELELQTRSKFRDPRSRVTDMD